MHIGDRLKQLRTENGILQKKLAEQLNLTQQTISLYESNRRQPDYDSLKKLAEYFNVSTDYLLGATDIKETINEAIKHITSEDGIKALEILEELYELSPESRGDVLKYIKMCQHWEKTKMA